MRRPRQPSPSARRRSVMVDRAGRRVFVTDPARGASNSGGSSAQIEAGNRPASLLMQGGSDIDRRRRRSHCDNMRNLTVSLDDETYRRARMIAAERDTSVSALVKRFLIELASGESEFERLKREERELREQITEFSASDRLSRDELYDRRR